MHIEVVTENSPDFMKGLMFRESLDKDTGMLFQFDKVDIQSFHMRNTQLPLDIAFINEEGVISSIEYLESNDPKSIFSKEPIKYALEMNRGWFNENNLSRGDCILEVSPPGWGHTKAEKEKTKPDKPKSKIGGTAHAMQQAQKRGDIPKNMNIFALMWSMKNKKDKPHYKPGVKDVLKKKYKGPEGQNEEKADEKPYPPTRLFKNVPNSVVKKANKEADKVKKKQEKAVLGEPPKNGPSGDSMNSTDNVYEDEKVDMVSAVVEYIKTNGKRRKTAGGDGRRTENEATAAELELANAKKADKKQQGGSLKHKVWPASASEDMSLAPKGKGRKAAKALYKEDEIDEVIGAVAGGVARGGAVVGRTGAKVIKRVAKGVGKGVVAGIAAMKDEEVENEGWGAVAKAADTLAAKSKAREDAARNKKVSSWAKGRKEEVSHFGDILRQAIAEAKKVDAIKEINKIVKTKTMGKLHGQKVDLFTASAIQQVYKAINHKNKEKMNSVMSKDIHGLLKMADFSMSKMKR